MNITKKITCLICVMIAGALSSCDEYLEAPTKSSLDESVIFSTPDLAKGAVDGIKLPFGETNSYRGRFLPWYGMNTDVEWYNSSQTAGDNADLAVYNAKPNNSNMNTENNAWAMMYSGIERANICIKGLRKYGDPAPGNELGYLLGEALTLRAVIYADLLKTWGDVVARFEPISTETIYLPKSSRDEIYKQLIADLAEASELVPWPNETTPTSSVERINKAFVKGLRARLCLAASGYSQYPDGIRRSEDPELSVASMYSVAYQECLDVINSGTAQLEPSFETLFRKLNEDDVAAGGESLWEIPFADGRGRMLFTFAIRHRSVDQHTGQARGGQAGPLPTVFYDYDVDDTRRDVTCVPYEWGTADATGFAKQQLTSLNTWAFGKYRYEWMDRIVTSTNDDGVNKLYMRYAEVVLMAAETANELEGPSAAAPYLKMIRQRAFNASDWPAKVDAYVGALTTKEAMFDAIVEEHKFEFCGEMERKQALIRWNLLKEKLDEAKAKMYALRDRTGEYADVPATLYFKHADDGESLVIYGLNRGESDNPGSDYTSTTYISPTQLVDTKIESLYLGDPNQRQFWPIWQVFVDGSNGKLTNDYGY
jgi:starch-binding outer membrane protein, SusD/RagB family